MGCETRAVLGGKAVVLAEYVALDLDDASARQAGDFLPRRIGRAVDMIGSAMRVTMIMRMLILVVMMVAVIMVMMAVMVMMPGMIMAVIMSMRMMMIVIAVIVMMITRLDRGLAVAAAAHRTHHSTSSSLTRMSSPPVTCS